MQQKKQKTKQQYPNLNLFLKHTEQVEYIKLLPFLLPGTYAVMSVMIGSVTERLAPESDFMTFDNISNSSNVNLTSLNAARVQVAVAVTCLSGLFQVGSPVVSCSWVQCPLLSSVISAGSSWFTSTWFFGDLFVRASGPRVHNRGRHSCHRVPAQIHLWHQSKETQWAFVSDICKKEHGH